VSKQLPPDSGALHAPQGTRLRPVGTWWVKPGYRAARAAILRNGGRDGVQEVLESLVLVEIEVTGATSSPDLVAWHQEGSDQVPWDELYTSLEGSVELPVPQEFRPSHLANRRYVYPD
jgi:hypothetical protein